MRRKHLRPQMAVIAAVAMAGLPSAAQARFDLNPAPATVAPAATQPAVASAASTADSSGFDWGDAGIGAAGTAVLLGAGLGGAGAVRRRRRAMAG